MYFIADSILLDTVSVNVPASMRRIAIKYVLYAGSEVQPLGKEE